MGILFKEFQYGFNMAKSSSYSIKTTPKLPPHQLQHGYPPPPLFVGVKLYIPPSHFVALTPRN